MLLPISQGFYVSESEPLAKLESVNAYPVNIETGTISQTAVFFTPGLEKVADAGSVDRNRGAILFNSKPYFVNDDTLYRLDRTVDSVTGVETFALVNLGTIPGTERVELAENGDQICIVIPELTTQFNAYIYSVAGGLVQISDVDFDGPVSSVRFVDGFFNFTKQDSQKFFISAIRDGLSYNALDFAEAESDPDPIQAQAIYRNQLIVFGTETLEAYQNLPQGADFPFVRTGVIERKGVFAPFTVREVDGILFWVGGTSREKPQVLAFTGGRPEIVSTRAVENVLSELTADQISDGFTWDYSEDGSTFLGFSFPGVGYSLVYDLSTKLWHTRTSVGDMSSSILYRVSAIVDAYGDLYVGDLVNGNIGRMKKSVLTEYGNEIKRRITTPPMDAKGERVVVNKAELVCETGVGLAPSQQGDDPKIRLSWSDDGGRTFSDTLERDLGQIGQYDNRVIWRQLGSFPRSRMFRIEVSDPVRVNLYKLEVDADA